MNPVGGTAEGRRDASLGTGREAGRDARPETGLSGTVGRAGPAGDVGRWFSTASAPPDARGLPRTPIWEPIPDEHYGEVSPASVTAEALEVLRGGPVAVLTGAGMSTGSGLPDYRGPSATTRMPMTYQEFMGSDLSRRRYWARSTVGWTQFRAAAPNDGHRALAHLGGPLEITAVITQNVDSLHQAAGSSPVIDLHGTLRRVRCQTCGTIVDRESFHSTLLALNPQVAAHIEDLAADAAQAPDGDAEVDRTESFVYPACTVCAGIMKPDVVFFGENADRSLVARSMDALERASTLLVLGSSLSVQSGLRFVRRAVKDGRAVVIVNDGPTRGDPMASVRVHGRLEDILCGWAEQLA